MEIPVLLKNQREYFNAGRTLPLEARLDALERFHAVVSDHADAIAEALYQDLNRPAFESYATETGILLQEISASRKHLRKWAAPRRVRAGIASFPSSAHIHPEPLGVVLVMAPWNYPIQLTLLPLAGVIAAGNCAVVKPSRRSAACAAVIEKIIAAAFDSNHVACVSGLGDSYDELLRERYDFIMYTGSARIGRVVMRAAAEHLTPVCLELGGKSPVIVTASANLDLAAKRIAWGKTLNAGQTCIAPDYLLAENSIKKELEGKISDWFTRLLGADPMANPNYGKIINEKAFDHLCSLAPVNSDRATLKIAPTILPDARPEDPVMAAEIFGPILPSLGFNRLDEAVSFIQAGEKPLALYMFSNNKAEADKVLARVSFGGGCVNDTILHVSSHNLPFGGVGESGTGRYHGRAGFDLFSNLKGVLKASARVDMPLRYPPGNKKFMGILKKIMK